MELSPVGLLLVLILCSYSGHTAAWQENPKAVLVLDRDQTQFYTGESVTLRCSIEGQDTSGWKFVWQRDGRYNYPQQGWSDKNEYITLDVSDGVEYKCHGVNDKEYSEWSKRVKLQVSALPTPTVTIEPESSVYVGERVTLKCEIQSESDWTYKWFKGSNSDHLSQPDTSTLSITAAAKSDESHYWCQGEMRGRAVSSLMSGHVYLFVKELPLATLTVEPQSPVFTGETVTLKCVIESLSGWTYKWYKESSRTPVSEGNTFNIRGAAESHKGQYWCQGERRDRPTSSQPSRRITLDVKAPKPKLTLSPDHQLLTGDSVTLRCELGVSSGLVFYWYRHTQTSDPVAQTDGNSYSISSVKVSDGGQYWCRAGRGDPVFYTQYSDAAEIKFIGVSPKASVIIHSNWTQIFTSEPLSLSCGVQGNSTGWRLRWFTGRGGESKCPTDWRSETGSSCSISSASPSDSGVYWCQSESGEQSNPVKITVHKGDVILESPVHPVTEGYPLTLRCRYRYQPSNFSAVFYKDGTLLQTSTTGEMTIPAVSKSHEGLYKCSNPERGLSPESRLIVRDAGSSKSMVAMGVVIRLLVAFALVISLVLLYRSQRAKGSASVMPNPGPQQSNSHSSTSQKRVLGGVVAGTGDVVYAEIELKETDKKKKAKRGAAMSDPLYSLLKPVKSPVSDSDRSSDVTYAKVKPKKHKKQDSAGPSDVTYADVEIKMKQLGSRVNQPQEHLYSAVKPGCSSKE
ncbi:sialoadhesin-like isoform X2 [Alosa pseudoharengus]|uniref:sialoadhesin-like isoform X2 n=1 Tax=Alosa pseudoharengus TaxID=34774 RepID=UPI003F8B69F1